MEKTTWDIAMPAHGKLGDSATCDVCIVGGGLAGLWCAYLLSKSGKRVIVLEADRIGRGATYYTTAMTTQDIDTDVTDLINIIGLRRARLVWQSGKEAIGLIESVVAEKAIDCDFMRCPLYIYVNKDEQFGELEEEHRAIAKLGFKAKIGAEDHLGIRQHGHITLPDQAKYHPLKFIAGLCKEIKAAGGLIFEQTEVTDILPRRASMTVTTAAANVECADVIIATYQPFKNPIETFMKKGMYISYMLDVEVEAGKIPEGLYLDLENPYHYFRLDRGATLDRLLIGGQDHRREIPLAPEKNFDALQTYVKELLGPIKHKTVNQWRGPILEPSDGLALIGKFKPHQYVATAFSGNGMTYAAISGMLITDLILGQKNPYQKLYNPRRTPGLKQLIVKGRDYTQELFGGAVKTALRPKK